VRAQPEKNRDSTLSFIAFIAYRSGVLVDDGRQWSVSIFTPVRMRLIWRLSRKQKLKRYIKHVLNYAM